jgi:hypothetical protein
MFRASAATLAIADEDRRELLQVIGRRSVPQSVALGVRMIPGASWKSETRSWGRASQTNNGENFAAAGALP